MALTFVAAPFYLRQAQAAFAALDRTLARRVAHARRRRGADVRARRDPGGRCRAWPPGCALAWGRALGEFGATLMFAGSFRGITQTVPLAIYERFSTDFTGALALSAVLVAVSAALLLVGQAAHGVGGARRCCALRLRARLGTLDLDVALEVRGRRVPRAGRPVGRGQDDVLRMRRRAAAARARAVVACGEEVWLDTGARRRSSPPERRRCGYVFQDYALFPHLSAWQNVAYGLRRHAARASAAGSALELLERFGARRTSPTPRPRTLSGGERQRVALARALARATRSCCCSTSRCPRSTRARAPRAARELAGVLQREPTCPPCSSPTTSREAALLGDRVGGDRRAAGSSSRARRPSSPRRRRPRSSPTSPAPSCCTGTARAGADGLTLVALDGGGEVVSAERVEGAVAVSVYPWEIALEPPGASHEARRGTTCAPRSRR